MSHTSSVTTAPLTRPAAATAPRRRRPSLAAGAATLARALLVPGGAAELGATPALPARGVQERLVALGELPRDAVSCRWDRRTANAIARFQARNGLAIDGVPGAETVSALDARSAA